MVFRHRRRRPWLLGEGGTGAETSVLLLETASDKLLLEGGSDAILLEGLA